MHTTLLFRTGRICALVIAIIAATISQPAVGLADGSNAKPVDLLKLIDPKRDAVDGDWRFESGALFVPKVNRARLQVPYTPPASYRLEMIVERKEGRDGLMVGLIVGGQQALVAIDCWDGRSSGFHLDGKDIFDNESSMRRRVIPDGKPCTLVFVVQPNGAEVTCDGQPVLNWHGDVARLSISKDWQDWTVPNRNCLFLADYQVSMRISKMEVTPLAGQNSTPSVAASSQTGLASTQQIVERVEPSIVVVEVTLEKGSSQGSGFLLDKQGTFVTNYHVIEGAKSVQVKFRDKSTASVPGYLAILPGKDIAVLRCEPGARQIEPLPLAATKPAKGEAVLTFGAPLGFGATVSDGIVSAIRSGSDVSEIMKGKSENDVYTNSMGYDLDATWLQITAPISPGNSGGPLVNMRAEVLGLNTWCLRSGQNLNFAISGEHIKTLLTSAGINHPFAELPKPREGREVAALGDADKTWAYWNELGQINRGLHSHIKNIKRPAVPNDRSKTKSFFAKMQNYYKDLAEIATTTSKKMKALDHDGVDGELVALSTVDAVSLDGLADLFRDFAIKAEIGEKVTIFDAARVSAKSYGKYRESDISVGYDLVRLALSGRYGKQYPNILGDAYKGVSVAKAKDGAASDGVADTATEKRASGKLKLAKQLVKEKPAKAKEMLMKLIEEFPGTKAAEEAQSLINEIERK